MAAIVMLDPRIVCNTHQRLCTLFVYDLVGPEASV